MYATLLILGLILSIRVVARKLRLEGIRATVFSPITIFAVYFGTIHFLTPLVKWQSSRFRYQSSYDAEVMIYTAVVSLAAFCFACAVESRNNRATLRLLNIGATPLRVHGNRAERVALRTGLFLGLVGSFFALNDLEQIRAAAGSIEYFLLDRQGFSVERSAERILANFLVPASGLMLAVLVASRRKFLVSLPFVTFNLILVYYAVAISSRNTILILTLINLAVYLFVGGKTKKIQDRKHSARNTILAGLIVATAGWIAFNTTTTRYSVSNSSYMEERRSAVAFYMLDGAFGNDEARMWLIENDHKYHFGETYLAAFSNVIPRSIWPNKPLGAGPRLTNSIRPGSYVRGLSGNTSLTPGLLVEARMNFGLPGVFMAIAAWSYFANRFLRAALREPSLVRRVMYVIIAVSLSSNLLYSEFLGWFARVGIVAFPLWLASHFESLTASRRGARYKRIA